MIERIIFFNGKKSHKELEFSPNEVYIIKGNENKEIEKKFIHQIQKQNIKSSYCIRKDIIYDNVNTGVRSQKIYNMTTHIYTYHKKPIKFNEYEREQIMFYCNKYDMDYRSIAHLYFVNGSFEKMIECINFINGTIADFKFAKTHSNN